MMTRSRLLDEIRAYAIEHYDEGWDVVIETMEPELISTLIGRRTSLASSIAKIQYDVVDLVVEGRSSSY